MSDDNDDQDFKPRRSVRSKKMSLKAAEAAATPNRRSLRNLLQSDDESDDFSDEKETIVDTVLADCEKTVGKDIFNFKKQIKHDIIDTRTPDSKSKNSDYLSTLHKTPKTVRKKLIKGIKSQMKYSSGEDFSDSGSEYSLSQEESEDETSESESEESSSEEDVKKTKDLKKGTIKNNVKSISTPSTPSVAKTKSKTQQKNYVINTEEFFLTNSSKNCKTSNHTLDKLKTPRLSQDELQKLLKVLKLSKPHEEAIYDIIQHSKRHYNKWMYVLHENFNVLLYGLGSKRSILQEFQKELLSDKPVIVVNGFFPSLTLKDILDGIFDILDLGESPGNPSEACEAISQELIKLTEFHIYLIIHNIEGPVLRNAKCQNTLAKLAAIKNIHLIATVDHINAPLVWDQYKLSKFNFTWWDVTSFLPYSFETSFENSILVKNTGNLGLSALRNVFMSLTANSKGIYLKMVEYQLENGNDQYYQGMLFKDLYWSCRESFLVSSDLALRTQLTEFVDHKMVKFKRAVDGAEYLIIPINSSLLQQFLDEQGKK